MAKRTPSLADEPASFARDVIDVPVAEEMSESFLAYSLSVITSRAIPDVRDGLKPVQRRILHAMHDMGLRPDSPHRKSARVVGETMGKYHPHGDGAIYDTLVRMGQDFARNICLVDPHGNFGSLDDPPAASRYTECRLSRAAVDTLGEIDEETVDFRPSYDGENEEPSVLPGLIPNLLVNGTTGIAVGMATNMAPHNLGEVAEAITLVLEQRRPKPTVAELMELVPGPDFPSGGIVIADGLAEAYETGRGSFRMRARAEIGQVTPRRQGITITELPYMVGPESVLKKIQELRAKGKLAGISDAKDLSDHTKGLRVVIECKTGINPQRVLAELYKLTPLETSFGINNVALVAGVPTTLGLRDLCQHYIDHRLEVIVRRTQFRLDKARRRLHIVEGLLIALDAIDEVIRIIRSSKDAAEARERLMERLDLTEIQATHILDMQLRRLTALEKLKLEEERDGLVAEIDGLEKILGSERRQRTLVKTELAAVVDAHSRERRTLIVAEDELAELDELPAAGAPEDLALEIGDDPCVITLSTTGVLGREGQDPKRGSFGRHDVLRSRLETSNHTTVHVLTSRGRSIRITAMEVAEVAGRSRGAAARDQVELARGEELLGLFVSDDDHPIVLVTRSGVTKRIAPFELDEGRAGDVINLKDDDRLVAAFSCPDSTDVLIAADDGQVLRTSSAGISLQGRSAGGVAGIKLKGRARVVGAGRADADTALLVVTTTGQAKLTESSEFPTKGRATGGVRVTKLAAGAKLALAHVGPLGHITVVVASGDDQSKPENAPQPLAVQPTRRDLTAAPTPTPILAAGLSRW